MLGRVGGRPIRHKTNRHLLTLAPNRSGKGVSSIIPNLLTWPESLVVIDPKGENAAVTARQRREMGQEVHVLDPFGVTGHRRSRFNPLLWLDPQDRNFVEDTYLGADSLHMTEGTKDEIFFSNEAKTRVAGDIMHIVATEPPVTRTLARLRAQLTFAQDEFDWLLDDMKRDTAAHGLRRTEGRDAQTTAQMRDALPRPLSCNAAYASMWMSRSVAATACNSARISALRAAPNACSNRRCAATHPLTPTR